MKVYRPFINSLFVLGIITQPVLADDQAVTAQTSDQTNPIKMLVFTAGASLADGYKLFKTSGGTGNITYALYDEKGEKEAQLPSDLTWGQDGVIRGTVPSTGFSASAIIYTVKAFDEGGGMASKKVALKINPPLNVQIDPIRLTAGGTPPTPIYAFRISGGTGKTQITFIDKNGVPVKAPGSLVFDANGGISGKVPDTAAGLDGMQARIVDEGGGVVEKNITWIISPPMTAVITDPVVTAGGAIPRDLIPVKVSGGTVPVKLGIYENDGRTSAILPDGVEFNEVNGSLSGHVNVHEAMEKHYIVKAVDQGGGILESKFTLKINKPLELLSDIN